MCDEHDHVVVNVSENDTAGNAGVTGGAGKAGLNSGEGMVGLTRTGLEKVVRNERTGVRRELDDGVVC